ncbi:MAG TPA: aminotransferase [Cytophagales bacterium]|nr:aminotransferase [Cytophagales bacterium]
MLQNQAHLFSLDQDVTFLNAAYMSPQLKAVEAVGLEAVVRKGRPYSISIEDFFQPVVRLKEVFAQLIGVEDSQRIALVPSVSYGLASVAHNLNLKPGDEIVLIQEQFPSNVYTWLATVEDAGAKIVTVEAPAAKPGRGKEWNARLLGAITSQTRMVAIPHIHWADGTLFDLQAVRAKTREHGAWLVLDGTQSVGALPFSVSDNQPDALVCGGYKWLMGPYSLGLAYYGPALDGGQPIENNWINRLNSDDFSNLVNYQPEYGPGATRFQVGELSNFILVPMLTKGIEQLLDWGVENIQEYTGEISHKAIQSLRELGCFIEEEGHRSQHLFGVHFPEDFPVSALKEKLIVEQVHVGYRGTSMRVSPHVYNSQEDFERLVACFRAVIG